MCVSHQTPVDLPQQDGYIYLQGVIFLLYVVQTSLGVTQTRL